MGTSLRVEIGDEDACVVAVHASAAEGYPASVAAPAVETVGIGAVGLAQRVAAVGLQVLYPQVAGLVPDVELSVASLGVEHITAVGAYAWQTDAVGM